MRHHERYQSETQVAVRAVKYVEQRRVGHQARGVASDNAAHHSRNSVTARTLEPRRVFTSVHKNGTTLVYMPTKITTVTTRPRAGLILFASTSVGMGAFRIRSMLDLGATQQSATVPKMNRPDSSTPRLTSCRHPFAPSSPRRTASQSQNTPTFFPRCTLQMSPPRPGFYLMPLAENDRSCTGKWRPSRLSPPRISCRRKPRTANLPHAREARPNEKPYARAAKGHDLLERHHSASPALKSSAMAR